MGSLNLVGLVWVRSAFHWHFIIEFRENNLPWWLWEEKRLWLCHTLTGNWLIQRNKLVPDQIYFLQVLQ